MDITEGIKYIYQVENIDDPLDVIEGSKQMAKGTDISIVCKISTLKTPFYADTQKHLWKLKRKNGKKHEPVYREKGTRTKQGGGSL